MTTRSTQPKSHKAKAGRGPLDAPDSFPCPYCHEGEVQRLATCVLCGTTTPVEVGTKVLHLAHTPQGYKAWEAGYNQYYYGQRRY
jgi:predicted RNA-binding Zn-ribbon protein involved in translation (DUF1610 family)